MSIDSIIKSSFIKEIELGKENYIGMLTAVAFALIIGIIISFIYRKCFGGVIYSRGFAETLIGMSVLTCMVTLAISTNVVISLGMVGSLSIIRYRTAVKSPLDLLYMFWAVTVGIASGAHMYILALITSFAMFIVVLFYRLKPLSGTLYVAVIHYTEAKAEEGILQTLGRGKYRIKSRTSYNDRTELAVEIFCSPKKLPYYQTIQQIEGVQDITVIQYNGEYHG